MSKAKTDPLAQPDNQIHWTPALQKKIPVLRGMHTPPLPKIKLKPLESGYIEQLAEVINPLNDAVKLLNTTKEKDRDEIFSQKLKDSLPTNNQWQTVIHNILTKGFEKKHKKQLTWLMRIMLLTLGTEKTAEYWLAEILKLPKGSCWHDHEKLSVYFVEYGFEALTVLQHAISLLGEYAYEQLVGQIGNFLDVIDPHVSTSDGKLIENHEDNNLVKQVLVASLFPELITQKHYEDMVINCHTKVGEWRRYSSVKSLIENISAPFAWQYHEMGTNTVHHEAVYIGYCLNQIQKKGIDAWQAIKVTLESINKYNKYQNVEKYLLPLIPLFHCQDAIDFCISHIKNKNIQTIFEEFQAQYPIFALQRLLASQTDKNFDTHKDNKAIAQVLLVNSLDNNPEHRKLLEQQLTAEENKQLQTIAPISNFNDDKLPDIFKIRPWKNTPSIKLSVVEVDPITKPVSFSTTLGETIALFNDLAEDYQNLNRETQKTILKRVGLNYNKLDEILDTQSVTPEDFHTLYDYEEGCHGIFLLPKNLAFHIWQQAPIKNIAHNDRWRNDGEKHIVHNALLTFSTDALPRLLELAKHNPKDYLAQMENIESDDLSLLALALLSKKNITHHALNYLERWHQTSIRNILPIAFKKSHKLKKNALQALEYLQKQFVDEGIDRLIEDTAKSYGNDMWQAWQAYKNVPAWQNISTKAPDIPSWLEITRLPTLIFKPKDDADTIELPSKYMADVVTTLMLSGNEIPYAGVDELKKAFTVSSLERVVIAIFDAWLTTNCKKDLWAFYALNWFTSAQTMRKLAKTVRYFVNNSSPSLALDTIDILANYATETKDDMGLVYLNDIASQNGLKNKFREPAQQHIYRIAKLRGLSHNELQDRLVPDFGLNERGQKLLDYGTRQFTVKLDETLMPYVVDADNVRLKSIPRLNKKDDKEKATEAKTWYKHFKKDIEKIANQQIKRLEQVMCSGQTWSVSEFENFLVKHPLMTNLCQRLLWGAYDNKQLTQCFRVAEDHSYLTVEDDLLDTLADTVRIGIVHPLFIPEAERKAWGDVFTDYEIIQPVEQLGRQTYAFTSEEIAANALTRFNDNAYYAGSLLSLLSRGWSNEKEVEAMMAGESFITGFSKKVAGAFVGINLDNGFYRDEVKTSKAQKITDISFDELHNTNKETDIKEVRKAELATLQKRNPLQVSEMLRDISLIQTD